MTERTPRGYVKIWALLCGLLGVSILGPMIGIGLLTLVTAFGVAAVKAYLVARHFMHLDVERPWVTYLLIAMVAFMVVLFSGVAPDVMEHEGHQWRSTAAAAGPPADAEAGR